MYQGHQHTSILKAISILNELADIEFYIISAGLGTVHHNEIIPAYECSFSGMRKSEIIRRSNELGIMKDFQRLVKNRYDFIFLGLGEKYLTSIYDWVSVIHSLTIAFLPSNNPNILSLKANGTVVKQFKEYGYLVHGTIGFKGDFLRIFAAEIRKHKDPKSTLRRILESKRKLEGFINNQIIQKKIKTIDLTERVARKS